MVDESGDEDDTEDEGGKEFPHDSPVQTEALEN